MVEWFGVREAHKLHVWQPTLTWKGGQLLTMRNLQGIYMLMIFLVSNSETVPGTFLFCLFKANAKPQPLDLYSSGRAESWAWQGLRWRLLFCQSQIGETRQPVDWTWRASKERHHRLIWSSPRKHASTAPTQRQKPCQLAISCHFSWVQKHP